MRTFLRSKATLLVLALGVLLAVPAVALADVVQSDVVEATAGQKVVSVQAGQTTSDIGYRINNTGGDTTDTTGGGSTTTNQTCNPEVKPAELTLSGLPSGVTVKDTSGNTLTAPHLTFTTCDTYQYVKLAVGSSVAAGDYTVSVSDITNDGYVSKDFTETPATFTLHVTSSGGTTNTAPQVSVTGVTNGDSYEIGSVPAAGCSVTDTEDGLNASTTAAAPQVSAITGTLSAYGLGSQTVTCTYTDGGGITRSANATYTIVDTGNPTITDLGPIAGTAGLNGWYTSQVTNRFRASDTGAGFQTTTPPLLSYNIDVQSGATQEGNAATPVVLSSGSVSDVAGNPAASVNSRNYKIDLFNPTVNITNAPAEGAKVDLCSGALPSPGFTANDTSLGSGVNTSSGSFTTQPNTASGVGAYTYTAQATDYAGRQGSATRNYSVVYDSNYSDTSGAYSGVLQPINLTGSRSSFKLGSTVPVKFTLSCNGTPITNAVAKLSLSNVDGSADAVNEAVATNAPDAGNTFRLTDATTGQYQFNLSTKAGYTFPAAGGGTVTLGQGTWYLWIQLDDGAKFQAASFDVKK